MFFGIPLTSNIKQGSWYVSFVHQGNNSCAVLSQMRAFHINRLNNRMGFIDQNDFKKIKQKMKELIFS